MTNFQITYKFPWLLLLIIPAVLLTLIPYFRLDKRYRFTRNKIISMMCHIIAMVLAVNLLAGIGFSYEVPNEENEVILLVDVSDSGEAYDDAQEDFIRSVIDVCDEGCKIGIVKFGYGYDYSVELTGDKTGIFDQYVLSDDPDGSATALADALKYTASLFKNKEFSKIIVISDGLETDGDALVALHEIVSEGTLIDTVLFQKEDAVDIQILSATVQEAEIVIGESFAIDLLIQSNSGDGEEVAVLRLYDNEKLYGETVISLKNGVNEIPVSLTFSERGMHELTFELVTDYELFGEPLEDTTKHNNSYRTYVNLEEFENILIIERYENEAAILKEIVSATKDVTDISVEEDFSAFPTTLEDMAAYEQILLVNIAYSDMPAGFEALLNQYVSELGGGLLTVGGRNDYDSEGKPVPHAYNREDLEKSQFFKHMLPVNAEDYTPPIAVMLVVDTSLSMKSTGKLEAAIEGAEVCLDALHDRDFCGIVSFSSASSERLSVLPVSQREIISEAIKKVSDDPAGGTIFSDAIMKAGRALSVINNVERKHMILITDGKPGDSYDDYKRYIEDNVDDGITMSVLTIGMDDAQKMAEMQKTAAEGGGKFYNVNNVSSIAGTMYKDLTEEAIPEIQYGKEFNLTVKDKSTIFSGIDSNAIPPLAGYYGTVAKKDATVPLMGEYVPIYAVHKYGKGNVGSFMCDLNGEWSAAFVNNIVGQALVMNIVDSIFPFQDVRADSIKYELKADNYAHWVNIHGTPEGQTVSVTVTPVSPSLQHLYGAIDVSAAESNRRFTFSLTQPGLYEIRIISSDELGNVITEIPVYKSFSYSEEYDTFTMTAEDGASLMTEMARMSGGTEIHDPVQVFGSFTETLHEEFDPRPILIIAAIVLMLLDIAARKFKFKWLHEVIKERKTAGQ
ncbi:MAG: VWA domain-containing protein [Ruminococcaceae bacterium]|nr:VWA domain-containing protein [Oscillospiraceae bacterium]